MRGDNAMNIMICDDQNAELENIKQFLSEYVLSRPEIFLNVKYFATPFDMLDEVHKNGTPDIAVLDICMPGILGTDVAREILKMSEGSTDIIFLTTSRDFAVEAFSLRAYDYLTKPYTKERFEDTLDRVIEKRRKRVYITVSGGREVRRIDIYNVLYVEVKNHSAEIHIKPNGRIKTRTPLTELRTQFLKADCFVPVGASYIINLLYVGCLLETELEMSNGDRIPIPRRIRSELKKKYFDFYTREATNK